MIHLIVGERNSGKSTRFLQLYQEAGGRDTALFSRKCLDASGDVGGYDLLLLPDETPIPLARLNRESALFPPADHLFQGRFVFSIATFSIAADYILNHPSPHVWIDEIGKLELQEQGYASLLHQLLTEKVNLTLTIRDTYLSDFLSIYSVADFQMK